MKTGSRALRAAMTILFLLAGQLYALGGAGAATGAAERCFAETGQCVGEPFLTYWETRGGLAIHGYPLTGVFTQRLEDGKDYQVQYFERSRFELHPENAAPYDILLGQFGRLLYLTDPAQPRSTAVAPIPGALYFDQTGHNLGGKFRAYWEANGGLAQFGVPLSEVFKERLEDGKEYEVQYFERARFELHPDNAPPYDVLLGQFGRRIVGALNPNAPLPYLISDWRGQLYRNNLGVRARLGLPTGPEMTMQAVVQGFERGAMIYRADTRTIYVAVRDTGHGLPLGNWRAFPDTWTEGQPVGGGDAPVPNLYYPQRGFGKVWRDNPEVQQRLGYALTPNEGLKGLVTQPFTGGQIIDLIDDPANTYYQVPGGIYVFYTNGRFEFAYHTYYGP